MIKIFRKIRQGALTNNKYSKYFLYALGEITLVVIGIIIALYLNSQKAKLETIDKQRNYLALINGEMQNNIVALSNENEDLATIINNLRTIISLMESDTSIKNIPENELSELLLLPISRTIRFDNQNGAFVELINSGGLKDIKNDSIRNVLRSWESKLNIVKEQENSLKQSLNKTISYVEANGNYRSFFDGIDFSEDLGLSNSTRISSNKHLLKSRKLENILLNYLAVAHQLHQKNYPRFENDMKNLIELIDIELKK